ncbi:MAG: dTDP-4-dehydrorhamnose reductase [Clostridia bacterium]|nr:dTDP-4-dehydrorhamnose reductase [Clostridia bacterium]MBR4458171.1 dTDP-4-dehydrorhamnose reductase [Clostridia bacterium]
MKILVTGAHGQLGRAVCAELNQKGIPCIAAGRDSFTLTDRESVDAFVRSAAPDAIIHCAAYTDVDRAELEPERCMAVNAQGTAFLAQAAADTGAKLLLVSTDYVFSGAAAEPYGPDDPRGPVNVYGLSKLQAEEAVRSLCKRSFIVRTSWLFSAEGSNFVRKILSQARETRSLRVVCDQTGCPTYAPDLAAYLVQLIRTDHYGITHAVNSGFCTRSEFASAILRLARIPCQVMPVPSSVVPSVARRPLNSRLDGAGTEPVLPTWQSGLQRCISDLVRTGAL